MSDEAKVTDVQAALSRTCVLDPSRSRLATFPIEHHDIWEMYKAHQRAIWTAEEIDLAGDVAELKKLTEEERHFVMRVLAFFAQADGVVNENIVLNFGEEVQMMEAKTFYHFQAMMEDVHNETYSRLIETYSRNNAERDALLSSASSIPTVGAKIDWCRKWMDRKSNNFAERLVAFAVVEGMFFSSSFCAIYWFKKKNLLKGLTISNEFISRDEGMHCNFACAMYHKLGEKVARLACPPSRIQEIVAEAVEIEIAFVKDSLPVRLIGMNADLMVQYVKFCADRLLVALSAEKLYDVLNPFEWMVLMSLDLKANFFESRESSYGLIGEGEEVEKGGYDDSGF